MAKQAKAMDMNGKGIVVRECMEASQVLPPDDSDNRPDAELVVRGEGVRVDRAETSVHDAAVVRAVRESWGRAQAGLVEILRFGATLLAVQERLENAFSSGERVPGHGWNKGTGLKAWLEKACPEINYKTAYGYMCAASGLRREARLAEDVPLLALMGEDPFPEARMEKLRARVQKVIAGATLGLLREAATAPQEASAKGGARDGAGRPKLEASAETRAGAAWGRIGPEIDRATAWHFESFLPEAIAREALATVRMLQDALAARVHECGKGARDVK